MASEGRCEQAVSSRLKAKCLSSYIGLHQSREGEIDELVCLYQKKSKNAENKKLSHLKFLFYLKIQVG